jgi:hypothetical protein
MVKAIRMLMIKAHPNKFWILHNEQALFTIKGNKLAASVVNFRNEASRECGVIGTVS